MLKKMMPLAIFAVLILTGMCCTSVAAETDSEVFQLKAKVMSIDLYQNQLVVAETEIGLLFHYEKGTKVWDTRFLDKKGNPVTPDQIEKRDRVLVRGESNDGKIIAHEITLLGPKK